MVPVVTRVPSLRASHRRNKEKWTAEVSNGNPDGSQARKRVERTAQPPSNEIGNEIGLHHLKPVSPSVFDDAAGMSTSDIAAGDPALRISADSSQTPTEETRPPSDRAGVTTHAHNRLAIAARYHDLSHGIG